MSKLRTILPLFTLAGIPLSSQSVAVLALQPEDTRKAVTLHAQFIQAEKNWNEFQKSVRDKYTITPERQAGVTGNCVGQEGGKDLYFRDGFCGDIQFSKDYRYILPAAVKP